MKQWKTFKDQIEQILANPNLEYFKYNPSIR